MKLLFCIFGLFISNTFLNSQVTKLRIDPTKSYGGTVSEYFESVDYIPLETTKESLFGDISKLTITDSSLIILDDDTKNVLFFDLNGKYLTKVKYFMGSSPIVFLLKRHKLVQFSYYNPVTAQKKYFYFTLTGAKVDKAPPVLIMDAALVFLDEDYSALINDCYSFASKEKIAGDTIHLLSIYKNDKLYKSLIPFTNSAYKAHCYLYPNLTSISTPYRDSFCYVVDFDFNIYKVTNEEARLLYKIVFPADRLFPKNIAQYKDLSSDDFRKGFESSNGQIIDYLYNVNIVNNTLMFKIAPLNLKLMWQDASKSEAQFNFFYNLKKANLLRTKE